MKINELAEKLNLTPLNSPEQYKDAQGCYAGDLLSLAMAKLSEGDVWITVQTNLNTIAVAALTEAGCIILPDGLSSEEATLKKATAENIPVYTSEKTTYELCADIRGLLT